MRIALPQQPVEAPGERDQKQRIERDRQEGEKEPGRGDRRPADHRGQRGGAARRMQRARQRHDGDREPDREARGEHRVMDKAGDGDADQGGERIAADDGPGLGEGACRHREDKHGRGADGRDDQGQMSAMPGDEGCDEAGKGDADDRPEACERAPAKGRAGEDGPEEAGAERSCGRVLGLHGRIRCQRASPPDWAPK